MPAPSTLALFALAALALIAIPGPNMVYVATRSMSEGRRSGFASALGLLTGTLINVAAAAAGLSALIASSATRSTRCATWARPISSSSASRPCCRRTERPGRAAEPVSLARAYRQAIVVQLLNPKVALFFLAFLPQFVDPARGPVATQVLVLGAILGTFGFAMDCGYALAAGAAAQASRRLQARRRVTGAVYLALGAAAALTGGRR